MVLPRDNINGTGHSDRFSEAEVSPVIIVSGLSSTRRGAIRGKKYLSLDPRRALAVLYQGGAASALIRMFYMLCQETNRPSLHPHSPSSLLLIALFVLLLFPPASLPPSSSSFLSELQRQIDEREPSLLQSEQLVGLARQQTQMQVQQQLLQQQSARLQRQQCVRLTLFPSSSSLLLFRLLLLLLVQRVCLRRCIDTTHD